MAACKLVAVLTLVVAASCETLDRQMYHDKSGDTELMYPEPNYVDSMEETTSTSRPLATNSHARKMAQYNMLQAWRNHASSSFPSAPKWIPTGTIFVPPDTFGYYPIQGPQGNMFKRSADQQAGPRPRLLRWKIKKGKAGSHMICYFKLCSFRPLS